jgi:hypothetical protein
MRRAEQQPHRIAVVDREGTWSYQRLADAAMAIADLAAGSDTVALVRRRSAGFAAAVLGCTRLGSRYLVLEPENVPTGTVVFDPRPAEAANGVSCFEELPHESGKQTDATEGAYGLTGVDRIAVLTGDTGLTMCALATALAVGAVLVLADEATTEDPEAMLTWLRDTAATAVYLTAPLLRTLRESAQPDLPFLRYVFLDNRGDLTAHDVEHIRQLAPGCRVIALYRPTAEGAPLAAYEVPATWSRSTAPLRVPIGRKVSGRPALLLNPAGRPAAVGEVAELWVDGVRIPDLVRRRPDRVLEFAGPPAGAGLSVTFADPLETVAVLRDLPDVRDAVLTEDRDPDGRGVLTAYLVCENSTVDHRRLRQQLVTHLPEYLLPRQVVTLERLPRTPDDGYDLAALADPGGDSEELPVEPILAIARTVLVKPDLTADDDLAEHGGTSLSIVRILAMASRTLNLDINPRDLDGTVTVRNLAQVARKS